MRSMVQVTEILDNAIDEVQAGHASTVQVLLADLRSYTTLSHVV